MNRFSDQQSAHRAAEQAARFSYGRLIAILALRTRDLAAAEDALAEAFRSALDSWPKRGVPDRPEAWLLTTARHTLDRRWRHEMVKANAAPAIEMLAAEAGEDAADGVFPDDRLKLLFVCAHPAIDPSIQAPLMLQTVLGLEAIHIASAFLTSPATMGQRLARAKAKIKSAGIAFDVPDPAELHDRLQSVMAAIYACFGTGWEDVLGEDPKRKGLAEEAIWLGRLLAELRPEDAEAKALLSLMLYCEARRPARRTPTGDFVPLDSQDVSRWSRPHIAEAETLLREAAKVGQLGRFQLEAAIQSAHIERLVTGASRWDALLALYELLASIAPAAGVLVAKAAVKAEAGAPERALDLLDQLQAEMEAYQPYWATRGRVLVLMARKDAAAECFRKAAGLSEDEAVRQFLIMRSQES